MVERWGVLKRANAHSSTFGFSRVNRNQKYSENRNDITVKKGTTSCSCLQADTQSQNKKPKELEFCQRLAGNTVLAP